MGLLTIFILSCKIVALVCLFVSIYSYNWFQVENYEANKDSIQDLCVSYGAFCKVEDQMPLPRLIVIIPCVFLAISLLLEVINLSLLSSLWSRVRTMFNYFLEQTSIALSFAITIHCFWVSLVHIRISMEMSFVHLDRKFFSFGLASILVPIDCICSTIRIMKNCQYVDTSQRKKHVQSARPFHTHHWIHSIDSSHHRGPTGHCVDYGEYCVYDKDMKRIAWIFCSIFLINGLLELLNISIMCAKNPSRINLILEEIEIIISLVVVGFSSLTCTIGLAATHYRPINKLEWSFHIFFIATVLGNIDLICSFMRVILYCRDNSFRSTSIAYKSDNHEETVHIRT